MGTINVAFWNLQNYCFGHKSLLLTKRGLRPLVSYTKRCSSGDALRDTQNCAKA